MTGVSVSVIVPMRNEETYISDCLHSLLQQTYPVDLYEVLVVDGRSSDQSTELVQKLMRTHRNLRILDNPAGIVPSAMNIGIRSASGKIIVRADGHSVYPAGYIANCVKYLAETGAENVGGPLLTVAANSGFSARLVAAVLTSPFGVGNSRFRTGTFEGEVETVPYGAFRRELFDRIGVYNEKLVRNQDNELNARIRAAGGRIFQTPALRTEYRPVAGFGQLLRTTFRTSQWHLLSLQENPHSMSFRHLAPGLMVCVLLALAAAAIAGRTAAEILAIGVIAYLLAGFAVAALRIRSYGLAIASVLPAACFCFHLSYGLGTLAGVRLLFRVSSSHPIREGQPVR